MGLYIATYAASVVGLVPGATPQDIFSIQAAPSKLVQVLYADIGFSQTTASLIDMYLLKRSTANTVGTFSNPAAIPYDSADPPATATVFAYTANPTAGTLVGTAFREKIFGPTTGAQEFPVAFDFDKASRKPIILRPGSQETLAFNLNGIVALAGWLFDVNIIWTEQ